MQVVPQVLDALVLAPEDAAGQPDAGRRLAPEDERVSASVLPWQLVDAVVPDDALGRLTSQRRNGRDERGLGHIAGDLADDLGVIRGHDAAIVPAAELDDAHRRTFGVHALRYPVGLR